MSSDSFFGIPGIDRPVDGLPELAPYGSQSGDREPTWGGEYVSDGNGVWTLDSTAEAVERAHQAVSKAMNGREAKHEEWMNDDVGYRHAYLEDQAARLAVARDDAMGRD